MNPRALSLVVLTSFAATLACGDAGRARCVISDAECEVAPVRVDGGPASLLDGGPFVPAAPTNPLQRPEERASGLHSPFDVALDATSIYVSDLGDGRIHKVARGGGASVELARAAAPARGIALDGERVYWVSGSGVEGRLRSVSSSGGAVDDHGLARLLPLVAKVIAFDATHLYWVDVGDDRNAPGGALNRAPKSGGARTAIVTGRHAPASLAVDDTSVYWVQANALDGEGTIHAAPKAGGVVRDLGTAGAAPGELLLRGDHLYWSTAGTSTGTRSLRRIAKAGGHPITLASAQGLGHRYAFVDGFLYFDGPGARILRAPSDGSAAPIPVGDSSGLLLAGAAGDRDDVFFAVEAGSSPGSGKLVRITP